VGSLLYQFSPYSFDDIKQATTISIKVKGRTITAIETDASPILTMPSQKSRKNNIHNVVAAKNVLFKFNTVT
jgi:hypothetical protein